MKTIKRALISVFDKEGIVDLAGFLAEKGIEILSSGGTFRLLSGKGIKVREISDYTGFPEILDGRVKTLHPKIHGGILAMRDNADHMSTLETHGIAAIDLVVVNLYPFREVVARPGTTLLEATENIDVGGPTMLRAAAKNFADVAVVIDPADYPLVKQMLKGKEGRIDAATRMSLAVKAFAYSSAYDQAIHEYLSKAAER